MRAKGRVAERCAKRLPSSAEEGKAEAQPRLGWCWSRKFNLLINTTPALHTPPHLEEGSFALGNTP